MEPNQKNERAHTIRPRFSPRLTARNLACLVILAAGGVRHAAAQTYAPPTNNDYGSNGTATVYVDIMPNPVYPTVNQQAVNVSIYHPGATIDTTLPTIFFAHGLTTALGSPSDYSALLNNLASRGYNVVFSPYEGTSSTATSVATRFDELVSGFDGAVSSKKLNTAQTGFVGHSFGGGFLPAVIQYAMLGATDAYPHTGHSWGGTAAFMFSMAPAYAFDGGGTTGVSGAQAITFPANLNVVEQVYNDDQTFTDPRLAIDIFYNITTPNSQKDFLTVYSDSHGTPAQVANHYLPATNSQITSTSLQAWAVFRHLDALAVYTFTGDATAGAIALGNGAAAETSNNFWSDGVAVRPQVETDLPSEAIYYPGPYEAQWSSSTNPRVNFPLAGPPQFATAGLSAGQVSLLASGLLAGRNYVEQATGNLTAGSWSNLSSFTAMQSTQTFTHPINSNGSPEFWRILAQ